MNYRVKTYEQFLNENLLKNLGKKMFSWLKENILGKLNGWIKEFYQAMLDGRVPMKGGKPVAVLFLAENGPIADQMKKYYTSVKNEAFAPLEYDKPEEDVKNVDTAEYIKRVKAAFKRMKRGGTYNPIFIFGASGIGKSEIVAQCAKELGAGFQELPVFLYSDISDLIGVPSQHNITDPKIEAGKMVDPGSGYTRFNAPATLPTDNNNGKGGILFLDELNLAQEHIMKKLQQFVLQNKLGDYKLPDGWLIVAAGNRECEAEVNELSGPLSRRFLILNFVPKIGTEIHPEKGFSITGDWAKYVTTDPKFEKTIIPEIVYFLTVNPEFFHRYDVESRPKVFPAPANWASAALNLKEECIDEGLDNWRQLDLKEISDIFKLRVGSEASAKFIEYLKIQILLNTNDMKNILKSPENAKLVSEFKKNRYYLYPIMSSLIDLVSPIKDPSKREQLDVEQTQSLLNIIKYIDRYGDSEVTVSLISMIFNRFPEIKKTDVEYKDEPGWSLRGEVAFLLQNSEKKT
jgi:hypothetical protein